MRRGRRGCKSARKEAVLRPLPLLLLASACVGGPAPQADLSKELAGLASGPPQQCVPFSPNANLVARDNRTLVYRRGDTIWVNRLEAPCPGLRPTSLLIIEHSGPDVCAFDTIRAAEPDSIITGPYCRLGLFTPWRR